MLQIYRLVLTVLSVSCLGATQAFTLTPQQIAAAQLDNQTATAVEQAVTEQRADWTSGPVSSEPIYSIPPNASHLQPGQLITLENETNTTTYALPQGTSLSRFTYISQNLNGSSVPASAYILWPFTARRFANSNSSGVPLVAWAHGSDGWLPDDAPSHFQDLYNGYAAPFSLAMQGYAVVAPDYAGLGVATDWDGKHVVHPWLANPAGANDVAFAIQAAQSAFPALSRSFVVMGHSQGGGVAWSFAQRQLRSPLPGYRGTVAVSPITSVVRQLQKIKILEPEIGVALANQMRGVFPDFEQRLFLTALGEARSDLTTQLGGEDSVFAALVAPGMLQPGWATNTYHVAAFDALTSNGGVPFAEPLLVMQGTADMAVDWAGVSGVVNATCGAAPGSSLRYVQFKGLDHDPTLTGSAPVWSRWIEERFEGRAVQRGCSRSFVEALH